MENNENNFFSFVLKVAAVSFASGVATAAGYHVGNAIFAPKKKEEPKQVEQPKQEEPATTVEAK